MLVSGSASATELFEARVTSGAALVLQNAGGTVRLEQPRLDLVGRTVFVVDVCGEGVLAPVGEQCDDGGTVAGDGCSAR